MNTEFGADAAGPDSRVNGPVVLITGAAGGIGWASAELMASRGWRVAVVDLRAEDAMERAGQLSGERHLGVGCDVTDQASVRRAVTAVVARYGRIDALVNNAGISDQTAPTLEQTVEAFDHVLAVHLRGAFLLSQSVLAQMRTQVPDAHGNRGAIVNIGSIASFGGIPGRNAYSAAKAGVLGMTRAMAIEWARCGIRVNAVAPGYVATALVKALAEKGAVNAEAIARRTPLGRMAQPAEIAEAIAFLAGSASSYITGTTLSVDGGWGVLGTPEAALAALDEGQSEQNFNKESRQC